VRPGSADQPTQLTEPALTLVLAFMTVLLFLELMNFLMFATNQRLLLPLHGSGTGFDFCSHLHLSHLLIGCLLLIFVVSFVRSLLVVIYQKHVVKKMSFLKIFLVRAFFPQSLESTKK